MTYYRRVGEVPAKRHSQLRDAAGRLMTEELFGEEGFFNASSLLYHRHSPSALVASEEVSPSPFDVDWRPNVPLRPRLLQTAELGPTFDAVTGRRVLVGNHEVRISHAVPTSASPLFRDALGDELVFIEAGSAVLESVFGRLEAGAGDYVRVPMGCVHRWVPDDADRPRMLIVEATGHIKTPARYLSPRGQFLEHAPYSERDLRGPGELVEGGDGEAEVLVRHRDGLTRHVHANHPFDVVGWDGYVYPYAFSIHDFEPIVKRFHAPPPVHETFTGAGFVVCSFCPRPADYDPTAVPVPYAHLAVDCDEVMFFTGGEYRARAGAGIRRGSITFHPGGFVHGPHPGAAEASLGNTWNDEYAVMVDTFQPLYLGPDGAACEDPGYQRSWLGP